MSHDCLMTFTRLSCDSHLQCWWPKLKEVLELNDLSQLEVSKFSQWLQRFRSPFDTVFKLVSRDASFVFCSGFTEVPSDISLTTSQLTSSISICVFKKLLLTEGDVNHVLAMAFGHCFGCQEQVWKILAQFKHHPLQASACFPNCVSTTEAHAFTFSSPSLVADGVWRA